STAKMKMPDAVHDGTPGQNILRMRDPSGQGGTATAFVVGISQFKFGGKTGNARERAGNGGVAGLGDVAAFEHVNGPGSFRGGKIALWRKIVGGGVSHFWWRQRGEVLLHFLF